MAGVSFLLVGSGLLTSLLAIRGGIEGFDTATLGLLGSAFFAGYLSGTYFVPAMIRRIGHIRAFSFLAAAVACSALLHELLINVWFWVLLRYVAGAAMFGLYMIVESWLNSFTLPAYRARAFTVYMAISLGSLAFAPQFLNWGSPADHKLFAISAILVCAAAMPVASTRLAQPTIENTPSIGLRALYEKAPVALITALFSGLAQGAFWGLSVVWADSSGMDNASVASFMSLSIIGGAVLQWPIGFITDRLDRGSVISVVSLAAALFALPMFFAGGDYTTFALIGGFIYGGFAFSLYPLAVARMIDRLTPGEVFSGNGTLLLVYGIGAAISPMLVGSLMHPLGPSALPGAYIVIEVVLALTIWILARRMPADVGQQSAFVPMVRTTSAAIGMLDPDRFENENLKTVRKV